jgi:hypothetical protein
MPVNSSLKSDALSGIEEETDIMAGFSPLVDPSNVAQLDETPPGKIFD